MKDILKVIADDKDFIFQEAYDFIKDKLVLSYEDYAKLSEKYKNLAFSVARYTEIEVLKQFKEKLLEAIENGSTKAQFETEMNTFLVDRGFSGLTPYRADTIFRINMQTAYSVGHYENMTDENVLRLRPYWQYQTAGDNHVRESHQMMDGKVFYANDPIWDTWYPPNGFGCRCNVVSLSAAQVKQRGLKVESEAPDILDRETGSLDKILPDENFRTNPAKQQFKPDLKGYPNALREAYNQSPKEK
jgi:SPP1 gp7 family putative phage head morphogenesis protein